MTPNWNLRGGAQVAIVLFSVLVPGASFALMLPLATTTLVDRAECIVEGTVAEIHCRWTDDRSAIISEVMLEPTDVLLGSTNRIVFQYEGGVVDGNEARVSDMPRLLVGQHVLVFLRPVTATEARRDHSLADTRIQYGLLGAGQGLYRIERTRALKEGFSVVGDTSVIDGDVDLAALKRLIRERLASTRAKRDVP